MKIIGASYEILQFPDHALTLIELAGRTCYKSEDRMDDESSEKFVRMILKRGHESVIEHAHAVVKFVFDRGVSHEMVRHRLCGFSQESTRYCDYSKKKRKQITGVEECPSITFIKPCFWDEIDEKYNIWYQTMVLCERAYFRLRDGGAKPEEARSVLPNSLKTEIVVSANFREWRHIFRLRTSKFAHPQMREAMIPCFDEFVSRCAPVFEDIEPFRG